MVLATLNFAFICGTTKLVHSGISCTNCHYLWRILRNLLRFIITVINFIIYNISCVIIIKISVTNLINTSSLTWLMLIWAHIRFGILALFGSFRIFFRDISISTWVALCIEGDIVRPVCARNKRLVIFRFHLKLIYTELRCIGLNFFCDIVIAAS